MYVEAFENLDVIPPRQAVQWLSHRVFDSKVAVVALASSLFKVLSLPIHMYCIYKHADIF